MSKGDIYVLEIREVDDPVAALSAPALQTLATDDPVQKLLAVQNRAHQLLRSSSLAIGIGLGYAIVVEQTAVSFSASVQNDIFQSVLNALPGTNSTVLAEAFGKVPEGFSIGVG